MGETIPTGPVPGDERLPALDLVRGVAMLGVLMTTIPGFSMPGEHFDTHVNDGSLSDRIVVATTVFLFEGKAITLFSILFGAGLAIQMDRFRRRGRPFVAYYVWRLTLLFLIGLAHGLFLWYGDILTTYAWVGLGALLVLSLLPRRWVLDGAGVCFFVFVAVMLLAVCLTLLFPEPVPPSASEISPENQVRIFRDGTFLEMTELRGSILLQRVPSVVLVTGWYFLGCFLLGTWLLRSGVFRNPATHTPLLARFLLFGMLVGILCNGIAAADSWHPVTFRASDLAIQLLLMIGSLAQALAILVILLWWSQSRTAEWLQSPLRAVGRTALTNYILQSLLCTLIFTGLGLGLYGRLNRTQDLLVVAGVWVVELLVSSWYLTRFRMGPIEWAWRSLCEFRPQFRGCAKRDPRL